MSFSGGMDGNTIVSVDGGDVDPWAAASESPSKLEGVGVVASSSSSSS